MKILVGYENSNVANQALEVAIKHARAFNAQLIVVTSMKGGPEVPRKTFDIAEKTLERAKSAVKKEGVACDTRLSVQGLPPGEDLVEIAEKYDVEEIVIGVKRRSKVGKMIFGSNAQYIILKAPCPVVAVK
jgi:nucleotide-binding universal stress UspA family protein